MTAGPGAASVAIFAPGGVGTVTAGADLARLVVEAVAADPAGPLRDGDIVVVTSKIISKAEGRTAPAAEREDLITAETARTVASRGRTRIVRTRRGQVLAAAGVDASNVARDQVLLLPADPDASARSLLLDLRRRTDARLGVVVSDTAGRPWRLGQTDLALGAAGVRVVQAYAGRHDRFGNELQVTAMAVADELAAAADLVKAKLAERPVAVVRGLGHLLSSNAGGAAQLVRPAAEDLFGLGTREAVLWAALQATGQDGRYEELVVLEPAEAADRIVDGAGCGPEAAELLRRMVDVASRPAV